MTSRTARPALRAGLVLAFSLLAARAASAQPAASSPPARQARPIVLAEAISLAQRNAPAAVQARGSLRNSAAAVRSAYAAFLPSLNLNASAAEQSPATPRVNPTTGELVAGRWATTEGFSMGLELFSGLRRWYDLRAARARLDASESSIDARRFELALQVKQQYYASLAAREAEAAALAQKAQADSQLVLSVAKVRARTATRSDSLRARIQVGQAELALANARNDRRVADAGLSRLVGLVEPVTASPEGLPADETLTVDEAALERLVADAPVVREAELTLAAARAASRAARSPYLPSLNLSYARNRVGASQEFDPFPDRFNYSGQLRFTLSLPVFNQWTRESNVVQADVALTTAEAATRDARLAAQQTLVEALGAATVARQQIATQTASVVAAEEDLRVQQQRYRLGASTILDVLTSQTQLTQARLALVQARFTARVARAQLDAIAGPRAGVAP